MQRKLVKETIFGKNIYFFLVKKVQNFLVLHSYFLLGSIFNNVF